MFIVIGAAAVDVVARRARFRAGTSNPASIRWAAGGVGYRIWRSLPSPKRLLTAVGDDPAGRWLEKRIVDSARVSRHPRFPTACYCAFMEAGRLRVGASDMDVIERGLTWARLRSPLAALTSKDLLVLDANLAPAVVDSILGRHGTRLRVAFEGVSVEKIRRHAAHLRDLFLLSVNADEARALRGAAAPRARGEGWVGSFLASRRMAHLLVGRGARGARLYARAADGRIRVHDAAPTRGIRARDTTGAGDRLHSALLARLARGLRPDRALPEAVRDVERAIEVGRL